MELQQIFHSAFWMIVVTCSLTTESYELGWSNWSSCSVSCGLGFRTKTRTCIKEPCPKDKLQQTLTSQCFKHCSKPENISDDQPPAESAETISPFVPLKPKTTLKPTKHTSSTTKRKHNSTPRKRKKSRSSTSFSGTSASSTAMLPTATTKKTTPKPTKHTSPTTKRQHNSTPRKRKNSRRAMSFSGTSASPTTMVSTATTLKTARSTLIRSKSPTSTVKITSTSTSTVHTTLPTSLSSVARKTSTELRNTQRSSTSQQSVSLVKREAPPSSKSTLKATLSTATVFTRGRQRRSTNNKPVTHKPKPTRGKSTGNPTKMKDSKKTCLVEKFEGIWWRQTEAGQVAVRPCPANSTGTASRRCLKKNNVRWSPIINLSKCVSTAFLKIKEKLDALQSCVNGSHPGCMDGSYYNVLESLVNETAPKDNNKTRLNGGDLVISIDSITIIRNNSKDFNRKTTKGFVDVVSNLLSVDNTETWRHAQKEHRQRNLALEVVTLLEDIGFAMASTLTNNTTGSILVPAANVAMKVDYIDSKQKSSSKVIKFKFRNTSVEIPVEVFADGNSSKLVTVIYPTLGHVLRLGRNTTKRPPTKGIAGLWPSTAIVSSSVLPRRSRNLRDPLKITLKNQQYRLNGSKITCVSWTPGTFQKWSRDGCRVVPGQSNHVHTTCECHHMTLFAALMDPYGTEISEEHRTILETISLVGCSISLIAVIATFCITLFHWKKLRSPRSEILLNICLSIAAVCTLVVVERPSRHNQIACSLVAVLLHYFLLSIFSWMLCEGLLLRLVFFSDITGSGRSKLRQFYMLGWGFPVLIVSASVGATQFHGYGERHVLCWLSTKNGLSWAFIAPAIFVVLVNTWILVLIMRQMLRIRQIRNKPRVERLRLGFRAAVVILPLLGITWMFGLLSFNSDTIVFKYLFAIFNSLQGVMIFIFHCILDNKVKEAIKNSHRRRQSMAMSVTRVRPVAKDDDNDHNTSAHSKRFSFAKITIKKDLSEKWDDLWARHRTPVTKLNHHQQQQQQQQQGNSEIAGCPRSLRMASLVFEIAPQVHQCRIKSHEDDTS